MNNSQEVLAAEILADANTHNIRPNQAIITYTKDGRIRAKDKQKILGIISGLIREMNKHDIKGESPKSRQKIKVLDKEPDIQTKN